ncbi:WD repeat-containing protein [Schistosoma japonicum]|uniref:WD repeat-containing protein n=1 Tax=Schistosoma japonicum TaxID=6182 RepID=A0A4Z2D3D4_SCHJA|nr:WD repeat-containing protein [Schistosoma japonicum]
MSEMAVWNWNNGKCLEFKMDTRYRHTYIKSHQTHYLDYRLLFCCGQYAHIVVLHATSLAVLFTLASNSQPDWISSFVVVTHPNQQNEIVLGLSFSNLAILWTLDGIETQGEVKYEHESRPIRCPSTIIQVDCCPQTPRCVLLVCSNGWQLFDAMTCSINCTISNPTNDVLVGGSFIQSNVISVYGQSGFVYLYSLPKSLIIYSKESVCSDVPVHIATFSPFDVNHHNDDGNKGSNIVNPLNTTTVQNFSCFTSSFIHPNDNVQYLLSGTIHGQLLAWCIKLDTLVNGKVFSDTANHNIWKPSSITDSNYNPNLLSPISSLDSSTTTTVLTNHHNNSTFLNDNDQPYVTVCIQLNQITCQQHLQGPPVLHPYRLAFGLSNGRVIIVRMVDFLKTIYWQQQHQWWRAHDTSQESCLADQNHHSHYLSKFSLDGHVGAVTSLLHPASCERQLYPNDFRPVNYSNNPDSATGTGSCNSITTEYQFKPDYLLSGGVDFTVRLWDLNPWHESTDSDYMNSSSNKKSTGNNYCKSICLAIYRCHASPCVGLTIGPPITSVNNMIAGNPRLATCICSFGADGSVWLINLKEKRPILYARNTSRLTSCPVVAIGWRLAEDLLLINYLDGTVTVWDISMGCLERIVTDQSARDLFEQAQFVTEVYHPSSFLAFNFSTLSSITMSSYKSRSLAGVPNHYPVVYTSAATPFCGGVNSACSSGAIHLTAPSRLKYSSVDDIQKLCTNRLPPVQLHLIGSTSQETKASDNTKDQLLSTWYFGPAAFVFHWDIESLIVDILSQNYGISKDTNESINHNNSTTTPSSPSLYRDDIFTMDVTQASFIQLIISLIHPWGIDPSIDEIIEQLCHRKSVTMNDLAILKNNHHHHQQQRMRGSVCIGLISKCGCMSLSMPAGISLTELMTSLNMNYVLRLSNILLTNLSSTVLSKSLINNSSNVTIMHSWRTNWLKFGAFLMEDFMKLILLHNSHSFHNNTVIEFNSKSYELPPIELNLFARKWQDRCLPIRYAARTLALICLDQLSLDDRKLLVSYWSALLPPFSFVNKGPPPSSQQQLQSQQQQTSRHLVYQQNSLDRYTHNVEYITDILADHTVVKTVRKQSLPAPMNGVEKYSEVSDFDLTPKDMSVLINNNTTTANHSNGLNGESIQQLSGKQSITPNKKLPAESLPNLTESVSMCSLTSNLNMSMVLDSSWWMTLNGYRISPREHARLQSIAIVLMGIIGVRFGSSTKRRHPAVVARDLISTPLVMTTNRTYEVMNQCNCGLAYPNFAPPDDMNDKSEMTSISIQQIPCSQSDVALSVEKFTRYSNNQFSEIQDGFGLDNHYLARSTCQCLSALLYNGGYPFLLPTDIHNPEIDWSKFHELTVDSNPSKDVLPVYAANALITLLTSNVNSTLRRAAIDLLGRGFPVWEPYVDVGQVINVLLLLAADAEVFISNNTSCQLISDSVDLARTAREALWAIGFARPKLITLALSLEVRRFGTQINAAASTLTSSSGGRTSISASSSPLNATSNNNHSSWSLTKSLSKDSDNHVTVFRRDSITIGNEFQSSSSNMVVMMTNPIVATPVFSSNSGSNASGTNFNRPTTGHGGADSSGLHNQQCPPMFKAREEVLRLFEQLCIRRPNDIKDVLPEVVEVILACSDRTRLKERGLDYVFPALTSFHSYSSHTRLQKACTGGINGSLTFYDFKIGRYFVTMGHKSPVTAVCFHSDGRQVATYSSVESTLRIWQLHTTGFFGMGGQQVKPLSVHPVPPLIPPPSSASKLSSVISSSESTISHNEHDNNPSLLSDRLQVWIEWPESRTLHLVTNIGIKRRIAL